MFVGSFVKLVVICRKVQVQISTLVFRDAKVKVSAGLTTVIFSNILCFFGPEASFQSAPDHAEIA